MPAASTVLASTSSDDWSVVATTTASSVFARCKRSSNRSNAGLPAMSDNTLPGSRDDAMRASTLATILGLPRTTSFRRSVDLAQLRPRSMHFADRRHQRVDLSVIQIIGAGLETDQLALVQPFRGRAQPVAVADVRQVEWKSLSTNGNPPLEQRKAIKRRNVAGEMRKALGGKRGTELRARRVHDVRIDAQRPHIIDMAATVANMGGLQTLQIGNPIAQSPAYVLPP